MYPRFRYAVQQLQIYTASAQGNLARCVVASHCNSHLNLGCTLLCTCCRLEQAHRRKALQASPLQLQANCHKMPQHPFRSGKSSAAILLHFAWWLHTCSCHSCCGSMHVAVVHTLWLHACYCDSHNAMRLSCCDAFRCMNSTFSMVPG